MKSKITLYELIRVTLIKTFLSLVSTRKELQSYPLKELWINWFKSSCYSLKTKIFHKSIFILLSIVLVCFLAFNLVLFGTMIYKNANGKPYAKAKAYNIAAVTINQTYIFPLSHLFGYKNVLTIPFYGIRDALYNKSQSLYPNNEGEKEINWFTVRYAEYKTFVHPLINDLMGWKPKTPKYKVPMIAAWIDELHEHLEPFATMPIYDPDLKKFRYNMFVNFAFDNFIHRHMLASYLATQDPENNYLEPILRNKEQVNKIEDSLIYLEKLKKYAQKNEKEGLTYFYNHTNNYYLDEYLTWEVSSTILYSKMVNNNLSCNDKYINTYRNSFLKLDNFYTKDFMAKERIVKLGNYASGEALDIALIQICPIQLSNLKNIEVVKSYWQILKQRNLDKNILGYKNITKSKKYKY